MTSQTSPKKRPVILIILAGVVGVFILCIVAALLANATGLLPDVTTTSAPPPTPLTPTLTPDPAQPFLEEYGGNPEVYDRIFSLTDCAELQKEFDQADANLKLQSPGTDQYQWGLGYMKAADKQMKSHGCY